MYIKYGDDVKSTFGIFETWARSKTASDVWTKTLDIENQQDLEKFAKYQNYVIKSFKIILSLKPAQRKILLRKEGSTRLARRWLIWSNTCFKIEYLP